jgi:hypothetical protein
MKKIIHIILFLLISNFISDFAQADCAGPIDRVIKTEVLSCKEILPLENAELLKKLEYFKGKEKTEIVDSYRGYELSARYGRLYIPPGLGLNCSNIHIGKEITLVIAYACCDGDPNPPCYLGYSEIIKQFEN